LVFGESRFVAGYGSFPRAVPRTAVIREGRINPVQLAGLDTHWPNSSRPALILPALMLRRMDVFDMPTALAACPRV